MVVVTFTATLSSSLQTNLHTQTSKNHIYTITCKPSPPSLLHLRRLLYKIPKTTPISSSNSNGVLSVKSYMEDSNTISGFANKVIGALPLIGLFARILSDEGGVGGDTIDFAEFRRRVGNKCTITDSRAFYEFKDRRGKSGEPLYVLLCCWLAAVGAGLLKSEEILEGVARLRLSDDIEFEEQNFISMMTEAKEKRAKLNVPAPAIPMEVRAEKAVDAIYVCCFGRDPIEEEDERLLRVMLSAVFPSIKQAEIVRVIKEKAKRVDEADEEDKYPEPKPLPIEAAKLQMKDLQFLKQKSEN